ncbi:MAG TPA: ATP-binding protein [Deltaproteobacteria bacterium]|jgi:flagellar biosynthesis protein FlhG|nr:ATP-binding protein [Deltaproteobacteria bacterium]
MDDVKNKMWAVGGGKGGVGKSLVTLLLGASLARLGRKVIMIDADLGGSNLHTFTGMRYPEYTLADFISRKVETIDQLVVDTPVNNLQLICGADDILGVANPKFTQKTRLFTHLKRLEADVILLDLGAGNSFTTIDFFLYAPNKIVVVTPQITSIQNAYGFIKSSLYRLLSQTFSKNTEAVELIKRASYSVQGETIDSIAKLYEAFKAFGEEYQEKLLTVVSGLNIKLLINMVRDNKEKNVSDIIRSVAKNYLGLDIEQFGIVQYDNVLNASINKMSGFLMDGKQCVANMNFYDIAYRINKDLARQAELLGAIAHEKEEPSPVGPSVAPLTPSGTSPAMTPSLGSAP